MRCDTVARALPQGDALVVDDLVRHHLRHCSTCRVEDSVYRRLREALGSLVDRSVAVDDELLEDILAALDRCDRRTGNRSRRAACLGGLAAAGAIVYAGRYRRS